MFSSHPVKTIFPHSGIYSVKKCINSSASTVCFIDDEQADQQFCIKILLPCDNDVLKMVDANTRTNYLLNGLNFNRRFNRDQDREPAQRIYQGLVSVDVIEYEGNNIKVVNLGELLVYPTEINLEAGKEYGLAMRVLDWRWQLPEQFPALGNEQGMEFLARELYYLHSSLQQDPNELAKICRRLGRMGGLYTKVDLNRRLFRKALNSPFMEAEKKQYRHINGLMSKAYKKCRKYFIQRSEEGKIKRYHGDLKATNLWVCPAMDTTFGYPVPEPQLMALDCIDFNAGFCYIDALSDIAMLAIDIELYTSSFFKHDIQRGRDLAHRFLEMYLDFAEEYQDFIWLLLEYYLTEKAMIGACVCALHDKKPNMSKQYLSIADARAKTLQSFLFEF